MPGTSIANSGFEPWTRWGACLCAVLLASTAGSGCARSGLLIDTDDLGAGGAGEGDRCRSVTVQARTEVVEVPGTVLLAFDRSGSMADDWNGEPRWRAAGRAVEAALRDAPASLTVGAVFFPSPNGMDSCVDPTGLACILVPELIIPGETCLVAPIDAPDHIAFAPAPEFLAAFEATSGPGGVVKHEPINGGLTPLGDALVVAADALHAAPRRGVATLVVVTDGDPNCEWNPVAAMDVVADLHAAGIDTYVLGLPGVVGQASTVLSDLATGGGTDTFITPEDATTLQRRFSEILQDSISVGFDSCTIALAPAADAPDALHLIVRERGSEHELPQVDGRGKRAWQVSADSATVELLGETCSAATEGGFQSLRFELGF